MQNQKEKHTERSEHHINPWTVEKVLLLSRKQGKENLEKKKGTIGWQLGRWNIPRNWRAPLPPTHAASTPT